MPEQSIRMRVKEVCQVLACSKDLLYKLNKQGRLRKYTEEGRRVAYWLRSEVLAYAQGLDPYAAQKEEEQGRRVSASYLEQTYNNKTCKILIDSKPVEDMSEHDFKLLNAFHAYNVVCVKKNDEYFCGIRANTFCVEFGDLEPGDFEGAGAEVVLVSGNYEGFRVHTLMEYRPCEQ